MGCGPWGHYESGTTEQLHFHFSLSCIAEGNGNPLQCSCLENPSDREAWWAAVYGIAESQTRLKQLSSSSSGNKILIDWWMNEKSWPQMLSKCYHTTLMALFSYFCSHMHTNGLPGSASGICQCSGHKRQGFNPWVGKILWRRVCNPLWYSCLENPMNTGAWQATVHKVAKSWTWLKQHSMHTHACTLIYTHAFLPVRIIWIS